MKLQSIVNKPQEATSFFKIVSQYDELRTQFDVLKAQHQTAEVESALSENLTNQQTLRDQFYNAQKNYKTKQKKS